MPLYDLDKIPFDESPFGVSPNKDVGVWTRRLRTMLEANRWSLGFGTSSYTLTGNPGGATTNRVRASASASSSSLASAANVTIGQGTGGRYVGPATQTGNGGPLVALPKKGYGYEHIRGDRVWGSRKLVEMIQWVAAEYYKIYGQIITIGDLNASSGHKSHQSGVDVDIYLPRKDGKPTYQSITINDPQYARDRLQTLIDLILINPITQIEFIFINDTSLVGHVGSGGGIINSEPNHDNHIHVRIKP